ncbi:MAG TPA: porin [Burkholderiaceae bacterium]|nr:porin [Burkholderiaceae bacterium]
MKKNLIAISALAAVAGITAAGSACAQSSVTLFGVVDAGVARVSGVGVSRTGLSTGGANISRLGFRGTEDLGGGLAASFWLEGGLDVDSGAGKSNGAFSFNRRSTVSLSGAFGEARLGRDDAATFLNTLIFDPFLTNGVGGTMSFIMLGAPIQVNNALSYFLPRDLGGFYGQVQYVFGEQLSSAANSKQGDYLGGRFGYRGGPVNASLATGKLKGATSADDVKINNLGASYDFGVVKPMLLWASEKKGTSKITAVQLGLTAPLGAGELRAQLSRYDTSSSNADWRKLAVGYGYNLSKRTQVYAAVARLKNSAGAQRAIGVQGLAASGTALGGSSSGFDIGIRHSF